RGRQWSGGDGGRGDHECIAGAGAARARLLTLSGSFSRIAREADWYKPGDSGTPLALQPVREITELPMSLRLHVRIGVRIVIEGGDGDLSLNVARNVVR